MMVQTQADPQISTAEQAAMDLKLALLHSIEQDGLVRPVHESRLHKAIDLLRANGADPARLRRLESMSCTFAQMRHFLRQGRVNAHASALLRLRRDAGAI
jgi:hypothetical protein